MGDPGELASVKGAVERDRGPPSVEEHILRPWITDLNAALRRQDVQEREDDLLHVLRLREPVGGGVHFAPGADESAVHRDDDVGVHPEDGRQLFDMGHYQVDRRVVISNPAAIGPAGHDLHAGFPDGVEIGPDGSQVLFREGLVPEIPDLEHPPDDGLFLRPQAGEHRGVELLPGVGQLAHEAALGVDEIFVTGLVADFLHRNRLLGQGRKAHQERQKGGEDAVSHNAKVFSFLNDSISLTTRFPEAST